MRGCRVVGMSTDQQPALNAWAAQRGIGLELRSDNAREWIARPHRGTYVFDEAHRLMAVISTEDVERHIAALLALRPELLASLPPEALQSGTSSAFGS